MPTQTLGYSEWSMSRISTPPPSTMRAVAVTITLAAIRIDGGSRRNFDIRRSIGFGRGASRAFRPTRASRRWSSLITEALPLAAERLHRLRPGGRNHRADQPEQRQEDADDEHHPVPLPQ